jgi:hemerythrin
MEREHSRIRAMLDKATQVFVRQGSPSEVNLILLELSGYTLSHFREEEALMRASSFPGLDAHKQEHERLSTYVRGLLDTSSKLDALKGALSALDYWIDTHIRVTDQEFHEFLHPAPVNPSQENHSQE